MYPTKYTNISKKTLMSANVKGKALIIFHTAELDSIDAERYPDLYTPNVRKLAEKAHDVLYIQAEDIPIGWSDKPESETPTMADFLAINDFLLKNHDREIIAVCDAGIARSGFVTFFLDVMNDNFEGIGYMEDYDGGAIFVTGRRGIGSRRYFTNSALTTYMICRLDIITIERLMKLRAIIERDTDT